MTSAWGSEGESASKQAAVEVRNKYLEDRSITFEGEFSEDVWADTSRGRKMLLEAGFADVDVRTAQLRGKHRDAAVAAETALAWPLTRYRIAHLEPTDQRRLKEETAAAIADINDLSWQSQVHYYRATSSVV